jgi:DNA invertase Pin-like site-specific DNA recombinase
MLIGYARVSTIEQDASLQIDALKEAGCVKIFRDKVSGAKSDRPGLQEALEYLREGDSLVVWRLDRLGRSLKHLIETVALLEERSIGFRSLQEAIDTCQITPINVPAVYIQNDPLIYAQDVPSVTS